VWHSDLPQDHADLKDIEKNALHSTAQRSLAERIVTDQAQNIDKVWNILLPLFGQFRDLFCDYLVAKRNEVGKLGTAQLSSATMKDTVQVIDVVAGKIIVEKEERRLCILHTVPGT
jgi:hypothetical protein